MNKLPAPKFYIASSSKFIEKCKDLTTFLEVKYDGIITRKWWLNYTTDNTSFTNMTDREYYSHPQVQSINTFDFEAIRKADYVIIITENSYKLTGALIELGYATALGKPIFVIGQLKRSAMVSHCIHFRNLEQFFEIMKRGQFNGIAEGLIEELI